MNHVEHQIQCAIIDWRDSWPIGNPRRLLYAIPNGGARSAITGAMLKKEGVTPGIPDLCLPVPRGGFGALYIEVKAPDGRLSPEQKAIGRLLLLERNAVLVVRSAQDAIDGINDYLGQK